MNHAAFNEVRSTPLFSTMTEEQFGCIAAGEIIDATAGTVLVTEGERQMFFLLIIEGEVRLTRDFDRQTVLMGEIKTGGFTGEVTLLLDISWVATARVSKPTRFFRLGEADFWHMVGACPSVARAIFRSAASKMRNIEGYTQQRENSLHWEPWRLAWRMNSIIRRRRRDGLRPISGRRPKKCKPFSVIYPETWGMII